VTGELAKELGYDAGFSKGTEPQHLATFIVRELAARAAHASPAAQSAPA
jgi:beta-lysine 5,6-aminomutase beta subunit